MNALIEEQIEGRGGNGTEPTSLLREAPRDADAVAGLTADEQILRAAIFDEIDRREWEFYGRPLGPGYIDEAFANQQRLDFADRVVARTRQLKFDDDAERKKK